MDTPVRSHHHLTLCVGGAQEDYDFHVKTLGLRNVKKTLLYDGRAPIYHLYYGNDVGAESTLITCFAMRQDGRVGRPGSGQAKTVSLSVCAPGLEYWQRRLTHRGIRNSVIERFGTRRIAFSHPCGIEYEIVEVKEDARQPWSGSEIPAEFALRGVYGVTVAVRDDREMIAFMTDAMGFKNAGRDGRDFRFEVGDGAPGRVVEVTHRPDMAQGSWTFGEGTIHHVAFKVEDDKAQADFKAYLEGLGYTDCSDPKDRGYFMSVYFRTPGGALFEAAYTLDGAFLRDETYEALGTTLQMPPWLADRRDEILATLEPITY
jgi:glyoxalase family protein